MVRSVFLGILPRTSRLRHGPKSTSAHEFPRHLERARGISVARQSGRRHCRTSGRASESVRGCVAAAGGTRSSAAKRVRLGRDANGGAAPRRQRRHSYRARVVSRITAVALARAVARLPAHSLAIDAALLLARCLSVARVPPAAAGARAMVSLEGDENFLQELDDALDEAPEPLTRACARGAAAACRPEDGAVHARSAGAAVGGPEPPPLIGPPAPARVHFDRGGLNPPPVDAAAAAEQAATGGPPLTASPPLTPVGAEEQQGRRVATAAPRRRPHPPDDGQPKRPRIRNRASAVRPPTRAHIASAPWQTRCGSCATSRRLAAGAIRSHALTAEGAQADAKARRAVCGMQGRTVETRSRLTPCPDSPRSGSAFPLATLPREVLMRVLGRVSAADLARCGVVCCALRRAADDDALWRRLYCHRWDRLTGAGTRRRSGRAAACAWKV